MNQVEYNETIINSKFVPTILIGSDNMSNEADNQQPNLDETYIFCQECLALGILRKFKQISYQHLKHIHKMTVDQYREKFPNAKLVSNVTSLVMSNQLHEGMLRKYNVDNPMELERFVQAKDTTMIERFGVTHPSESSTLLAKKRNRFLDKYGVDNPAKLDSTKQKIKETFLSRYGVDHPMKTEVVKQKLRDYFADNNNMQNMLDAVRKSLLQKYGVDNAYKIDYVRAKRSRYFSLPTKPERQIIDLQIANLVYVGDWKLWFTFSDHSIKCPDFLVLSNDNHIKVLEYFGGYWHDEKVTGLSREEHTRITIERYASIGIGCLVIWDNDLSDLINLRQQILSFIFEGSTTKDYRSDSII